MRWIIIGVVLSLSSGWVSGQELPVRVIQIVRDRDSGYFDALIAGWTSELQQLADGEYRVEVRDDLNAAGDLDQVETLLARALSDATVDVVFAAGVAATSVAARIDPERRVNPVVGGAIEFADLDDSLLQVGGASSLKNFTFVRSPRRIAADLERLAQLAGTRRIHAIVDRNAIEFFGESLQAQVERVESRLGVDLVLVPGYESAEASLAELPADARAVYVSILVATSAPERTRLFEGLAERGVFSFSMTGRLDVERGALAGLSPDQRPAIHRRMALNIHQVLNGIPTELLPVTLRSEDRLFINLRTARRIGWSPDYDTVLVADLLDQDPAMNGAAELTLEGALERAAKRNPDVLAQEARRRRAAFQVDTLRASYRPSVSLVAQGAYQGTSDRIDRIQTPRHLERVSLGAELTQLLFSDRVASGITAGRESSRGAEQDLESIRLDVTESAGIAFLDVLLTDALHRIEKENLQLIENNLQLAKVRREIGVAEASEVFRWESNRARARSQLIQRDSDRRNARVQLNVVLGVPRTARFDLVDIQLEPNEFYYLDGQLGELIRNSREFEDFLEYARTVAPERAPEIRSFERALAAQGVLLNERRRRNLLPEIRLTASYDRVLQDSSFSSTDSQNEWLVGIGFVIPLFEGGRRRSEIGEIQETVVELSQQRNAALYLIEQRALAAGYGVMASHPALRLGRLAREAAERSYAAIETKYSQGAATIVDLLDAQRELLSQRQEEAAAGYRYLQDIVALQRATSWFEYNKNPEERARWRSAIRTFIDERAPDVGGSR